jgi:hypothetical protein
MLSGFCSYPFVCYCFSLLLSRFLPNDFATDWMAALKQSFDRMHSASQRPVSLFFSLLSLLCLLFLFLMQCQFLFRMNGGSEALLSLLFLILRQRQFRFRLIDGFVARFLRLNAYGLTTTPLLSVYLSILLNPSLSGTHFLSPLSLVLALSLPEAASVSLPTN